MATFGPCSRSDGQKPVPPFIIVLSWTLCGGQFSSGHHLHLQVQLGLQLPDHAPCFLARAATTLSLSSQKNRVEGKEFDNGSLKGDSWATSTNLPLVSSIRSSITTSAIVLVGTECRRRTHCPTHGTSKSTFICCRTSCSCITRENCFPWHQPTLDSMFGHWLFCLFP